MMTPELVPTAWIVRRKGLVIRGSNTGRSM